MKLDALIKILPSPVVRGPCDRDIAGLACDSRRVKPGYLFFAVPGLKCDGFAFVEDAIRHGAAAVVSAITDASVARDLCHIQVPDVREAMARLASAFHGDPAARLRLAGVTGTNGKTTVAFMLRDMLAAEGLAPGLLGTVEYRIGERTIPASRTTPESIDLQSYFAQMLQAGAASAVMEVSSHALHQKRVLGLDFDVGVFTNLTHDHLDYHGGMEAYFEAKKLLFASLGRGKKAAVAVINIDDPWGRRLAAMPDLRARLVTYGRDPSAVVSARDVSVEPAGSTATLATPWGEGRLALKLLGKYNVYNALAAVAAAGALGAPLDRALQVLAALGTIPGRLEQVPTRKGFSVFVDYAHTDDALRNVLETLREVTRGRLLVVFGCGGNRDAGKRPAMGAAAAALADHAIVTSDNPRSEDPMRIIEQICAGFGEAKHYDVVPDREAAIKRAVALAQRGDVVLIAGKGHENFQEFANRVVPFDDRQVVRQLV